MLQLNRSYKYPPGFHFTVYLMLRREKEFHFFIESFIMRTKKRTDRSRFRNAEKQDAPTVVFTGKRRCDCGRREMKKSRYMALYEGGEGMITEKKSRFIATIEPVETMEEAEAFIERIKKKYWDARHNCHAFTVGTDMPLSRCSDDGEPSGTAGKPMLEVLLGREIHNAAVVVTRYFGGTLLGTGGLVRAYTQAVQEGLANCRIVEKCLGWSYELCMDYTELGKVQYQLAEQNICIHNTIYEEKVRMEVLIPEGEENIVEKKLTEATYGKIQMQKGRQIVFGSVDGEIVIF